MNPQIYRIEFLEDKHEYWYTDVARGRFQLHGITGAIGKLLGKDFPKTDTVLFASTYGSEVHKSVERYYNEQNKQVVLEDAQWVIDTLETPSRASERGFSVECEVMVSDFKGTASKIDVVQHTPEGVKLYDIKTTSHFDRNYCSLQLSVYKDLYERNYGEKVIGLYVLGTKSKRVFHILYQGKDKVEKILAMNLGEE